LPAPVRARKIGGLDKHRSIPGRTAACARFLLFYGNGAISLRQISKKRALRSRREPASVMCHCLAKIVVVYIIFRTFK